MVSDDAAYLRCGHGAVASVHKHYPVQALMRYGRVQSGGQGENRGGAAESAPAAMAVARYHKFPADEILRSEWHSVRVGAIQDLMALKLDQASVMREGRGTTVRMSMRNGEYVMARAAKEQGRDRD